MVVEIEPQSSQPEPLVLKVFLKSIELLGGLKQLAEYRTLTWLPSIARAAYAVVLQEEYNKFAEEIASEIGLTKQTVQNILRADPDLAMGKIKRMKELVEEEGQEIRTHTAGGLAKLAYKLIKEGHDLNLLALEYSTQMADTFQEEIPWVYQVLKNIKDVDFPIQDPQFIKEKLGKIQVKGKSIEELADKLSYPINNPAELLKQLKNSAQSY